MQYTDDLITRFVSNYNQPYPVELPGIGFCTISSGTVTPSTQPDNAPWLRVDFTMGSTINTTIGTTSTILKSEPFSLDVQIFVPRTTNTNQQAYTYSVPSTIERHLDGFLITNGFNAAGETGVIASAQDEPKFKANDTEETWRTVIINYQYLYRYF